MTQREFLDFLAVAERLKGVTRHSYTTNGTHEAVAGHSWRISLMAMLLAPEFPEIDMEKVTRMCLIHDLGEAITGDIPSFLKTDADEDVEAKAIQSIVALLSGPQEALLRGLFAEMDALATPEARFYKALDKMEAVIQHNESPLSTWTPEEYELNRTYAIGNAAEFPWLKELRALMSEDTEKKLAAGVSDK